MPVIADAASVVRVDRSYDEIIAELNERLGRILSALAARVLRRALSARKLVDRWNRAQLEPQFKALELPLPRRGSRIALELDRFRDANVELITNMADDFKARISGIVDRSVRQATRVEDLAKDLERIPGIAGRRAKLIGRDQALKLYGNLTQARHQEAGIARYVWSTSLDERVRDGHQALEGTTQNWAEPPDTGNGLNHPGQDIQCRCVAVPVLDD